MKEKSINFNNEMIQAIIDGRKTQTRRVIKPQPKNLIAEHGVVDGHFGYLSQRGPALDDHDELWVKCPYGVVGDNVLAKEAPSLYPTITLEVASIRVERLQDISEDDAVSEGVVEIENPKKSPPDNFSYLIPGKPSYGMANHAFRDLWDSIHKDGFEWDKNPWVWVISFKKLNQEKS